MIMSRPMKRVRSDRARARGFLVRDSIVAHERVRVVGDRAKQALTNGLDSQKQDEMREREIASLRFAGVFVLLTKRIARKR